MGAGESSAGDGNQDPIIDRSQYYDGPNVIELAYSPLGGFGGFTAYHSSVVVNGTEYFFDGNGIESSSNFASHQFADQQGGDGNLPGGAAGQPADFANSQQSMTTSSSSSRGGPQGGGGGAPAQRSKMQIMKMGKSNKTGTQLVQALRKYFPAGHYDLLRKNCNSFSDVALFYCLGIRLDKSFRKMEKLGQSWQGLLGDQYEPNPMADNFDVETVIADIDPAKMWRTPGYTLGTGSVTTPGGQQPSGGAGEGAGQLSAEEMRRKRLEALEKRQQALALAENNKPNVNE
ncbi:unnamed protein product [Amoebophrya sp. A120]|nr:unnamed protein product [Amoebophrya sp. A120]|eukprot:GSA120T00015466001.1